MLLGEHLQAEEVAYRDCELFQVVCPACREPVFKGVRESEGIHYLSHYRSSESYDSDCELRVGRMGSSTREEHNALSRKQRLDYFLSVIQDALLESGLGKQEDDHRKARGVYAQAQRSKVMTKLCWFVRDSAIKQHKESGSWDITDILEDYERDIREVGGEFYQTTFGIHIQRRIANDMWRHILTDTVKKNFHFLFVHGYLQLMIRTELALQSDPQPYHFRILYDSMARILQGSRKKGQAVMEQLQQVSVGPPYADYPMHLALKMIFEIMYEMMGALLRLPYFELLKQGYVSKLKASPDAR